MFATLTTRSSLTAATIPKKDADKHSVFQNNERGHAAAQNIWAFCRFAALGRKRKGAFFTF
jgi:hypothetical protein